MAGNHSWTEKPTETLKQLFADGLSASQIASQIGLRHEVKYSRNAVISKIHRLGLPGTRRKKPKPRLTEADTRRLKTRKRLNATPWRTKPKKMEHMFTELGPEFDTPIIDKLIPERQRKTLMQLTEHTCRWPVGDVGAADFFFCGGSSLPERPYCLSHCRVAYRSGA